MLWTELFKKILSTDYPYKPVFIHIFTRIGVEKQTYWKRTKIILKDITIKRVKANNEYRLVFPHRHTHIHIRTFGAGRWEENEWENYGELWALEKKKTTDSDLDNHYVSTRGK